MALQNNFEYENASSLRTTQASDKGWLMWGNDNGSRFFDTPITNATVNVRLGKTWKTKKTGTISAPFVRIGGNFQRAIDLIPGQTYYLVTDTDGVFDASSTIAASATPTFKTAGDVTTQYLDFGQVDFSTNTFFTVATYQQAPGGVVAGYVQGLRVEGYNEFPQGNTSATDNENSIGKDSPYSVPHHMFYVSDFINPDDASINNLGLSNEEAWMEMYGEMNMADTTQKVFNYTGTTNDMFSLWIDDQPIITGVATANSEGVYTPSSTGWKKIRVKWSNRASTGDMNLTYKNNASTCAGACINIPSNLLRVYAPQTAWYKAGTRIFTDSAGTAPISTNSVHTIRWDSVSPLINPTGRTDGGNLFKNSTADLINGNPVIDNFSDKFLGGSGQSLFENRLQLTWGLPMLNAGRTLYSVATATTPTAQQFMLGYGDDATPTARYIYMLENNSGEIMARDHQINIGEVSPGTIENQSTNTPFVMGVSYNGGDSTATTANTDTMWGNGKRTNYRTTSISM